MKRILLLSGIFLAFIAKAQNCPPAPFLDIRDFSFEQTPGNGAMGTDWLNCSLGQGYSSDIQPIPDKNVEVSTTPIPAKAGNGKTYLGFFACRSLGATTYNWREFAVQVLTKPMKAGTTYRFTIDLMVPKERWEGGVACNPTQTVARKRTFPGAITIRGSMNTCEDATTKILWTSPAVPNDSQWQTYEFSITPQSNFTILTLAAEIPPGITSTDEIRDYICVDALRPVKPDSIKTKSTDVKCPNGSDGTGTVILSPTANLPTKSIVWSNGKTDVKEITDLKPGKYYVTVTDAKGFIMCDSIVIKEPKPYKVEITATDTKCFDSKDASATVVAIEARQPITYSWDPSGQTSATAVNIGAGKYVCTVKDSAGCIQKAEIEVKQPTKIIATSTHTDVTVPNGEDGTATAINPTGGTPGYTYLWNDSKKQTTATATNLIAGTYTCTITDKNGCTFEVVEKIKQPDAFELKIDTIHNLCFGDTKGSIILHPSKGTPKYTYVWEPNVSSDSAAVNLPAGKYKCTIKDLKGAMVIANIVIRQPDELKADISGKNITCFASNNGEAAVSNTTGGIKSYTYAWNPGSATTPSLTNLSPGSYSCLVTDNNGCKITKVVTITEPPKLIVIPVIKNISCFGYKDGNVLLTTTGGVKPYEYVLNNSIAQADSNFKNLAAGSYSCSVKDANGCTAPGTFILAEPPTPVKTTANTPVTCKNGADGTASVEILGSTGTVSYTWAPGGYTTGSIANIKAGTYVCKILYNSGACSTDTSVTVTEPDSVKLHIDPQTICYGKSATLTAEATGGNGGPYTIIWNNGAFTGNPYVVSPLNSSTYTAVATDAKGCKSAAFSVFITVKPPLKVKAATPVSICVGKSATLTAAASGGDGTYSYEWLPAGTGITATVTVTPATTTLYTVNLTDGCGTPPVQDTVRITVIQKPTVDFTADIHEGCPVLCVKYTGIAAITGDVIKDWKWDFGDGTHDVKQNPSHCYTNPGFYTIKLYVKADKSGCENDTTKPNYIQVFEVPKADFNISPYITTLESPNISFFNQSSTNVATWAWNFGDKNDAANNTSNIENPTHAYSDTGTYCVQLKVATDKKCPADITKCLRVKPEVSIYVPNAFTPNADGTNDGFFAKGRYIKEFKMWIFDRWGMLIFTSDDINYQWNGRVNNTGESVQQDSYVYKIQAIDYENKKHDLVGRVSIIR